MTESSISQLVDQWLAIDANPKTIKEIQDLQRSNNTDELELRLRCRIAFGTAGLRAKMEAGFSRMNDVTVLQASQGLASYVIQQSPTEPSVIVGHDHRHHSKEFAEITATAFLLKGFKVYFLETREGSDLVPTPIVPFSVDYYGASCGVMITASHNPAQDNGYKVYWGNGCQIIPPHDHGIAEEIEKNLKPVERAFESKEVMAQFEKSGMLRYVKKEATEKYLEKMKSHIQRQVAGLRFVYTPMHGVGHEMFTRVATLLGVEDGDCIVVKEQVAPDPNFPTVKFPNPEEKGALTLAMKTADAEEIDIVIANDPDADRFSAAVKVDGVWRQLTGNEIGFLFAHHVWKTSNVPAEKLYMLNSTVSSQMIASMAKREGFSYTDTLTGFKWIGNKAIELEKEGNVVPFAYEEAIGFMFEGIHDKDGISASLIFLQIAQGWKESGSNAIEVLEEGFKRYGYFKEYNSYYIVPSPDATKEIFDSVIRSTDNKHAYPATIGKYQVTCWRDLTTGYESATADKKPVLPVDASSQMITVKLATSKDTDEIRFTARGSGTEPKLKVYIEAKSDTEERAAYLAADVWATLRDEWFRPEMTGLKMA